MADDVTLLPCPMCGGTDIRIAHLSASPDQSIWCYSCQLRTKWCYSDDAIALWNTRVPDARVAALGAELARLREKAELGEAVEEMAGHDWMLCPPGHIGNRLWTVLDGKTGDLIGEGDTPLAALRAAKGEKTDHAH